MPWKQAALRLGEKRIIGQKDLVEAAEAEKAHSRDEVNEIMLRAFLWSLMGHEKWLQFSIAGSIEYRNHKV